MRPQTRIGSQGFVRRTARTPAARATKEVGKGAPLPCRQRTRTNRLDGFGSSLAARVAKQTGTDTFAPRWQRFCSSLAAQATKQARRARLVRRWHSPSSSATCAGPRPYPCALAVVPRGRVCYNLKVLAENVLLETHARVVEWQTRGSQKPLGATSCEFDSRLGHHPDKRPPGLAHARPGGPFRTWR